MAPAGVWNGHARFTFFCKKTAVFASENPRLLLMQVCKDVHRQSVPPSRSAIQIFHFVLLSLFNIFIKTDFSNNCYIFYFKMYGEGGGEFCLGGFFLGGKGAGEGGCGIYGYCRFF